MLSQLLVSRRTRRLDGRFRRDFLSATGNLKKKGGKKFCPMGIALWIGETKLWTARAVRTFPAFRLAVGAKRLKGVVCPQCFDTGCVVGAAVCGQPHAGANPQARFKLVVRQMEKMEPCARAVRPRPTSLTGWPSPTGGRRGLVYANPALHTAMLAATHRSAAQFQNVNPRAYFTASYQLRTNRIRFRGLRSRQG